MLTAVLFTQCKETGPEKKLVLYKSWNHSIQKILHEFYLSIIPMLLERVRMGQVLDSRKNKVPWQEKQNRKTNPR